MSSKSRHAAPRPSAQEVAQVVEAGAALTLASVAIRFLPFRTIVRLMGVANDQAGASEGGSAAAAVGVAVQRASRRLPWRTVCFHQGLAAHWILRWHDYPSQLHYGLKQGGGKLSAHVWVTLAGQTVIGEEAHDPHVCVAVFPQANADGGPR